MTARQLPLLHADMADSHKLEQSYLGPPQQEAVLHDKQRGEQHIRAPRMACTAYNSQWMAQQMI